MAAFVCGSVEQLVLAIYKYGHLLLICVRRQTRLVDNVGKVREC
jgi:hypothetical protein